MRRATRDEYVRWYARLKGSPHAQASSLMQALMPHQRAFVEDYSPLKSLLAPRRAGKTRASDAYLYLAATRPEAVCKAWVSRGVPPVARYWAPTRDRAKELMWRSLIRFAEEWGISIRAKESEQTIYTSNGGEIRLVGADKDKDAQKKRGDPTILEIIDEASVYGDFLESMIESVIEPSLGDFMGTCVLQGTPGILWKGFWFDVSGPELPDLPAKTLGLRQAWKRFFFDVYDNSFLPHMRDAIEAKRKKKGWSLTDPTYLREDRGQWVKDTGVLYFEWDEVRNVYDGQLPNLPRGQEWEYALGWDMGNPKNQALSLLAFSDHHPDTLEVYSRRGFDSVGEICRTAEALNTRFGGRITYRVADTGGLGAVITSEAMDRYGVFFEPAKKVEKYAFVQLLNEDLRLGKFKTIPGSVLSQEMATVPKDADDERETDKRFPDHAAHAAMYAWRRAKHFQFDPNAIREEPEYGSEEARTREAERLEEQEIYGGEQRRSWWEA